MDIGIIINDALPGTISAVIALIVQGLKCVIN